METPNVDTQIKMIVGDTIERSDVAYKVVNL